MRFVISVWNLMDSDEKFEETNPLLYLAQRKSEIGSSLDIDVLVLSGFEKLSERYKSTLESFGVILHNATYLTRQVEVDFPRLAVNYERWGGIRHYGIMRFLIIPLMFPGEDICFFDSDMLPNARLEELKVEFLDKTFVLGGSTCLGAISDAEWWKELRRGAVLLETDPDKFAKTYAPGNSAEVCLDPKRAGGSDQALVKYMIASGALRQDDVPFFTADQGDLVLFPNWLHLGLKARGWKYQRHKGIDYLNGKKVGISHMSNDFCSFLGFFLWVKYVKRWHDFGRLPAPYFALVEGAQDEEKTTLYRNVKKTYLTKRALSSSVASIIDDPFSRRSVLKHFYEDSDFSEVFNDKWWWQSDVFL